MISVHGGDAGVDVVEVFDVVHQLGVVLHVLEVGPSCAWSVSVLVGGTSCA